MPVKVPSSRVNVCAFVRPRAMRCKNKGDLLHEERPFIHLLNHNLAKERCDHCYNKSDGIKVCKRCSLTRYCDVSCQKEAWPVHKHECSRLKKLPPHRELPSAARLLARIIMKLKYGGETERGYYDDKTKFRLFKDLMSHYPNMKKDPKRAEHATSLYAVLTDFLGDENLPNFAEFIGLYGRMTVNGFSILDGEMNSLGTGIYLGASTIDHSCRPNAVAVFNGTSLTIRAIQNISSFEWSKVRIAYVEMLMPKMVRDCDLWSTYYFHCECERCSDELDLEMAASCPQCSSGLVGRTKMICTQCGFKTPEDFDKKFEEVIDLTMTQLENMKQVILLDVCKICLDKQKPMFHPSNVFHVKTLDMAFEATISLKNWEEAAQLGQKLIEGFIRWYGECHPLTGLLYLKLAKILAVLDKTNEEELDAAGRILKLTHGVHHPLFQEEFYPLASNSARIQLLER